MSEELKTMLAEKAKEGLKPSPYKSLKEMLTRMSSQIQEALPSHMSAQRLARIALTEVRKNPKLLQASQASFIGALLTTAQLGLEPGALHQVYFVPYYNTKLQSFEVQLIVGYKGLLDLVYRSGEISSISANTVYSNDFFEFEYGLNEKLRHIPKIDGPRGEFYAVYAIAHFKNGSYHFVVMTKEEIERIRKRSKTPNNGPWVTDYDAMALKTVIKQLCKYLPMSVEVEKALAADETTKRGVDEDMIELPDQTDWNEPKESESDQQPNQTNQQIEASKDPTMSKIKKIYYRLKELYPNTEDRQKVIKELRNKYNVKSLTLLSEAQAEAILDDLH